MNPRSRTPPRAPAPAPGGPADVETALRRLQGTCICGNLRMAARQVTAYYDAALRPSGIGASQMMMLWVAHACDGMPARELARAAGMDSSTASRNLAVLESRGLVSATPAPGDRRQRRVKLTGRGRATLVRALPHWHRAQAEIGVLTADVADVLGIARALRNVARRLQDASGAGA